MNLRRKLIPSELDTTFIYWHSFLDQSIIEWATLVHGRLDTVRNPTRIHTYTLVTLIVKEFTIWLREEYRCPNTFEKRRGIK